ASEAVSPIQNKVGQFLSSSLIRNIVGQVKSSIDLRQVMDEGKVLIMNLSKGRIGEDNSALLGAMMITKIQLAAMSRVNVPEKERKDIYLYIDEFQNFTTESFANILSEARKYRLNLIMAHQYIEQLGDTVKAAVFGNVGTLAVFRVGAADAEELVKEFTPTFTEEDIVNLPKYEVYLKLMIDGIASDPFSARGLPPLTEESKTGNVDKVIKVTRERYAKERKVVEDKIMRWHENETETEKKDNGPVRKNIVTNRKVNIENSTKPLRAMTENKMPEKNIIEDNVYKHETVCSRCNKKTRTSFKPDGIRPVFCKDCLADLRNEKREELELRKKAKKDELAKISNEQKNNRSKFTNSALDSNAKKGMERDGLSLNEVSKMRPVEFKSPSKKSPEATESKENIVNESKEEDLEEGKTVDL
ncbi:MAG: CxxC-x17-CxxC domain-containing protein, partial [Patescibacteria group bacterium]